ncbi:hypothetical protein Sjap_015573 [Stephania japonica]|uniref:Uncharacterized protein n=1 Tax=Stephania japonica TaxID=461633 RepID=A0AAP0IKY8_9MAGN
MRVGWLLGRGMQFTFSAVLGRGNSVTRNCHCSNAKILPCSHSTPLRLLRMYDQSQNNILLDLEIRFAHPHRRSRVSAMRAASSTLHNHQWRIHSR